MSKELRSQLFMEISTRVERTVYQLLDALSHAVLKSEIQASLHIARTHWIASLEERMAKMIERVAPTVISPLLSDLQVLIEKTMFGQF